MRRILILGASGAGTSTLGRAVASTLAVPHFDVDDFFWLPTDPPFTARRESDERLALLVAALSAHPGWVLAGSILKWGDPLVPRIDLVVYLTIDAGVRMNRLRRRERQRYGTRIEPGGDMADLHQAFLTWAAA